MRVQPLQIQAKEDPKEKNFINFSSKGQADNFFVGVIAELRAIIVVVAAASIKIEMHILRVVSQNVLAFIKKGRTMITMEELITMAIS